MEFKTLQKLIKVAAKEEMNSSDAFNQTRINDAIDEIPSDCKSILCIGVGDGYELTKIPNAVGLEINKNSILKIKEKKLNVVEGDMHEIPFDDKSFDLVFARHCLEHSPATFSCFFEMCRVAKKYLILVLPSDYMEHSHWHFLIPNDRQILEMARKNGFIIKLHWQNSKLPEGIVWENGYLLERIGEKLEQYA